MASELARELGPCDRVILEGAMGAGKSTFAGKLIEALGVSRPAEGSPSFAIAHEYEARKGGVIHVDFFRLKSEEEIDEAGIPGYFWERDAIVISEWLSSWPDFERRILDPLGRKDCRNWRVRLDYVPGQDLLRSVVIERLG